MVLGEYLKVEKRKKNDFRVVDGTLCHISGGHLEKERERFNFPLQRFGRPQITALFSYRSCPVPASPIAKSKEEKYHGMRRHVFKSP